jgi:hypothetical protein
LYGIPLQTAQYALRWRGDGWLTARCLFSLVILIYFERLIGLATHDPTSQTKEDDNNNNNNIDDSFGLYRSSMDIVVGNAPPPTLTLDGVR